MGLISCLNALNRAGANVGLLDCLSPMWSDIPWPKIQKFGQGHFPKTPVPKPQTLEDIPRQFSRYGLPFDAVKRSLIQMHTAPDLVVLTCTMTYWYPGALSMAHLIREIWPRTPVVLGGIYATLCPDHARNTEVFDLVVQGRLEDKENWNRIWKLLDSTPPPLPENSGEDFEQHHFYPPDFSVILGSRGCPFSCDYCASSCLYPGFKQRDSDQIWKEVSVQLERGVYNFVFYDDALLVNPEQWLIPVLHKLAQTGSTIRLHTPNALHVRYLTPKMCKLLYAAGLTTIRLGLESADFENRPDSKLTKQEWDQGLENLFAAGFQPEQIGAYILFGLPGQDPGNIVRAVNFVHKYGIRPHLAYYSPIPGSELFPLAMENTPYPIDEEPLFQNRAIWPCYPGGFSWEEHKKWQSLLKP